MIIFQRNGTKIPTQWEDKKDAGILVIENISKIHQNIYFCKAKSPVKTIIAKTEILVQDRNEKLFGSTNITATCKMFSATVHWFTKTTIDSQTVAILLFKLSSATQWEKRKIFIIFL